MYLYQTDYFFLKFCRELPLNDIGLKEAETHCKFCVVLLCSSLHCLTHFHVELHAYDFVFILMFPFYYTYSVAIHNISSYIHVALFTVNCIVNASGINTLQKFEKVKKFQ